ncbi:pyruvate dehydrogenase E2 component (dihydrolipoamide acetyltransferase) [Bauldia litoralis]|uniref:Pyruvate dehydrogenase E2 component (Dihydrolipoamide acetyltransferase) n=2 Tax=Bauldia litoralis TaxID=665467 RepID=A0A1G6EHF7_9HYPH|nr:pyruvate dehydrogenase E2 component (dihydrolipoamide acetyltransferase) [Bauldia litoralis]
MTVESRRPTRIPNWWEPEDDGDKASSPEENHMAEIQPITMPKWGLAMEEGMLARWAVDIGTPIELGQEIMDIETSKIANVFESPVTGVLRRRVVADGDTVPVGALLGVVAAPEVSEEAVDDFVRTFLEGFVPEEAGAASGPSAETVEAGGRRIRRLKAGPDTGKPIVFIHGFGADLSTWMLNQAALAEDRPVHAIDLPGHGGSEKALDDGSPAGLATAVIDYMDAEGIESAHLVGHSLGAAIAATIALDAPSRVDGLTLVAPAGFGPEIAGDFIAGFIAESRARKLRPWLEMLVADPQMVTAEMVEDVLKFKRLDGALAALQAVAAANFDGDAQRHSLRDRLADIAAPVHVVWGAEDRILSVAHAEGLPANVTVTVIPGAGHIVHMEKAADVNALIAGA